MMTILSQRTISWAYLLHVNKLKVQQQIRNQMICVNELRLKVERHVWIERLTWEKQQLHFLKIKHSNKGEASMPCLCYAIFTADFALFTALFTQALILLLK